MIGQSIINIRSGGRNRLSTLCAGCFFLFLILVMGDWVQRIPMAALVAVMIMVSIGTFNWGYLRKIQVMPKSETTVMVVTVIATIVSHNLAIGVGIGVALSAVFFARKIAQLVFVDSSLSPDGNERIYKISGQIFFVSVDSFLAAFNFDEELEWVILDLTQAHLWDQSAIMAIDKVVLKFRRKGAEVKLVGLNEASATLVDRLAVHNKVDALQDLSAH